MNILPIQFLISTNEKEILQSASDKTSENMFPNSFPFQFCIFEFDLIRKIKISILIDIVPLQGS